MKKLTQNDPETRSPDGVAENIQRLKTLFPELVTEGPNGAAVNVDVLKALVGDATVTDADEKYGLNWHGKRRARQLALTPSTGTLRPCPEDSVDWDTTQNLMIEGDNLEVLKLLQKSYAGKVKLIYIDPPYNTGKDFVYPDDFKDNIKNYQQLMGWRDEEGEKVSSLARNSEASGRFHTAWLNMMYPRLKLARNLLRDDGALFMTIDDTEVSNLRKMADEIFGEENFVANVVWQKKYAVANDDPGIGAMHDHILVYQKSNTFRRGLLPRTDQQNARYSNPDNDPRGPWASDNYVSNKSKDERPTLWYPIIHPKTGQEVWPDEHAVWRYSRERHQEIEAEGRLYWGPDFSYKKPRLKRYLNEVQDGIVPPSWWPFEECGHNDEAQKETGQLLGRKVFSTPKPLRLIDRMLTIANDSNAIVMDFFAGSGATAHAVMARNAADSGTRRFVLVQLPEPLSLDNADQRAAAELCTQLGVPLNIAELTKERLRRAAKKIKDENPMFAGDLGFRVFKLDSSNIRAWEPDRDNLDQTLHDSMEHIKADRTESDMLYELLLKLGLDLCVPIESRTFAGKEVHSVGGGVLMACLAPKIERAEVEALAQGIVDWHKALAPAGDTTCVFRDSAFADDVAKTNMAAILEQHGITNVRSL
ncbi:site-specific DNA-methyltransferase [Burkholderia multivorans]|uniref:site-specific DNA-methyltransferase n=1 Tax=Burkholderia multivorans TaxID=87883 RepID=UPI0021BFA52F|nr:site-specific DNA-methyltransferase [Burkholderia multivorans]